MGLFDFIWHGKITLTMMTGRLVRRLNQEMERKAWEHGGSEIWLPTPQKRVVTAFYFILFKSWEQDRKITLQWALDKRWSEPDSPWFMIIQISSRKRISAFLKKMQKIFL